MNNRITGFLLLAAIFPLWSYAEQTSVVPETARKTVQALTGNCPIAETMDETGEPVFFWQHQFDDGSHDLAMARTEHYSLLEIRRVTFGGSKQQGCHYSGLAIARGGDWGWHLAWTLAAAADKPALRYARMDGVAWVSSPAKRFGDATAHNPALSAEGEALKLGWQETVNGKQQGRIAISDDAGRNWR